MYSPKIRDELIPVLYHYSKHMEEPMTRTVDRMIYRSLRQAPLPSEASIQLPDLSHPYFRDLVAAYGKRARE